MAGSIKAGGNADVNAGGDLTIVANNKGRVVNVAWGETEEERAGNYLIDAQYNETGTQIDIKGKLNMSAGGNLTAQGATINAAAIGAKAGNDIVVMGRRTGYQYESVLNSGDVSRTTKRTDLTNQLSNWNAGNISMNAGRDITLQGVNLNGANVSLAAGRNLSAIEVYDIKETVDINSSVSMFRQRVSIDINSERTAIGNSIGNGTGVVTRTAGNNILDRGTTIAGIAQSTIAGNRVSEEAIKSTIHQERTRTKGGAFWVSTQSQGSTQETLQMTNIFVPSNASRFQGGGGVSVQLPKGSDLRAQIDRLKGQPGNEYLGQLAERSDIDWQEVEVINKTWNYKKETMGPATAIIVAIGVSLLTGGVGGMASSFGGTVSTTLGLTGTSASVVSAAASAGFSSLASMTATAVINNGGDLGAALEELGSSANVKSLLVSMVTAGALQGITDNIPVDLMGADGEVVKGTLSQVNAKTGTFAQLLGKNMVSAIASATISSAVNGGSLEDSLKASLISAFIDTAAANGAYQIGNLTNDGKLSQTLAENFANKLMHGALGCAIGAAKANSEAGCASGAIGGVVGHATADALDGFNLDPSQVQELGKLTSVVAGLLAKQDLQGLNIAMSTAQNAIANNKQLRPQERAIAKQLLAKSGGKYTLQQIEDALRITGNTKLGNTAITDMIVDINDPKQIYDSGAAFDQSQSNDKNELVQVFRMKNVDLEMAKFILENTGGVNSPYYSDLKKIIKPDNSLSTRNSYNSIVANANGCITAECAAGIEERAKTPPDYVSAQAGAFGVSGGVSLNLLNGDVYLGGGKGNLTQGVGTSLLFGKLYAPNLYGDARANAVSNFLGGASFQATACYSIVCAGINKSIARPTADPTTAYEFGLGGGVSAGVGYSDTLIQNSKP